MRLGTGAQSGWSQQWWHPITTEHSLSAASAVSLTLGGGARCSEPSWLPWESKQQG